MAEVLRTSIPELGLPRVGKVREVYEDGDEVLIVATDRISAFDCVMANGIPDKGRILNQMSSFWFSTFSDLCPNHVISTDDDVIAARLDAPHPELAGRTTLARKAAPLPIECVVRGYLAGSLYKEYRESGGGVHGLDLSDGMVDSDLLPEPIFTPATKAPTGHDENISFSKAVDLVGWEVAAYVREMSLAIYGRAAAHASARGIILADTKFEFGLDEHGTLTLGDEVCTPDSSRFWPLDGYSPGGPQPSYDKQFVRDWASSTGWDKSPPAPPIPDDVVARTRDKYVEAYERVTGRSFASWRERTRASA
jgi:phosphoribosylaminoimidazole-succinocarboxamide synthase